MAFLWFFFVFDLGRLDRGCIECCGVTYYDPNTAGFWFALLLSSGWLVLRSLIWGRRVGGYPTWVERSKDGVSWALAVARPYLVEALPTLMLLLSFCCGGSQATDTLSQGGNLLAHLLLSGLGMGLFLVAPVLGASLGSVMGQDAQRGYRLAQGLAMGCLGWFVLLPLTYKATWELLGSLRPALAFPVLPLSLAGLGAILWLRSCQPALPRPEVPRLRWLPRSTVFAITGLTCYWMLRNAGEEMVPFTIGLALILGLALDRALSWLPQPGLLVWQKTTALSALLGFLAAVGGTGVLIAIISMDGYWGWYQWPKDLVAGCRIGLGVGLLQTAGSAIKRVLNSPDGLWSLAGEV